MQVYDSPKLLLDAMLQIHNEAYKELVSKIYNDSKSIVRQKMTADEYGADIAKINTFYKHLGGSVCIVDRIDDLEKFYPGLHFNPDEVRYIGSGDILYLYRKDNHFGGDRVYLLVNLSGLPNGLPKY